MPSDLLSTAPRLNVLLKAARGHHVVDVRSILLIAADERYCRVTCTDGSQKRAFHTLTELEKVLCTGERMGDLLFLRTHRSCIAAFHHVIGFDGPQSVKLTGDIVAPISRQQRAMVFAIAGTVRPAH